MPISKSRPTYTKGPSQEERIWGSNRPPIKLSYKVSDPEELSSDLNGNAGHKPISRKMKLDDGVDTEDSFAVATSSAAMPKLEVIVTNVASKGQIMLRNYELYGKLEKVHRDDIVQILVDHCIEQEHFIMESVNKIMQFYDYLIPKLFPKEDSNTYFIPPQTDGIQQKRT
ncbi:hypothetical protein Anas_13835 [Armadillidium nasatum]|uniref:Uncharacterized protein n=1 Tax=Armadillidium nasatum TaxID=96803 RepID=A0A5N5THV9_9CRUS|nr:hypothetical protein Anas_13835 [Armadillidium nasatum]